MTIFLVGGGPEADLAEIYDPFAGAVRERGRRIALLLLGQAEDFTPLLPLYTDPIMARIPDATIEVIELADPDEGERDTQWPEDLDQVDGIIVGGGWTPGYHSALIPKREVIARLVASDVPFLGFAAGASVSSRHALLGGWKLDGIRVQPDIAAEGLEDVTLADGLALISPTVQVRTDDWSNEGVLISLIESGAIGSAVSIDAGTALVVDPLNGRTTRLGRGRLRWFSKDHGAVTVRTDAPPVPEAEPEPAESAEPPVAEPTESAPQASAPTESDPGQNAQADSGSTESTPAESAPSESTPAESAPAEAAPAEAAPADVTQSDPSQASATQTQTQTSEHPASEGTAPADQQG